MATTTTNFGWDIPQSTDLVKDGATAIATLGQDIDTALVDLKGGTTGQMLTKASNTDLDYTWVTPEIGDITAVTAGSGLSGGGTTGAVTVSLDLTAANVYTAAQTATRYIVTGSTVATNGMYLPATNTLGFSTNSTVRMRINANGEFGIGAAPATAYAINSGIDATGATDAGFLQIIQSIKSDVTATYRGIWSKPATEATSFTITNVRHFQAEGVTVGATSTVTNQVGFLAQSNLTGATNNYGFQGAIASGTNRFNLYMSGTAANLLVGRTGIGSSISTTFQARVNNVQSTTDITLGTMNFAAQTADSISVQNSAASTIWGVTAAGFMKYIAGNTATTVGAAGGASALPATPTGYLKIDIGGTEYKVPYYAA